MKYNIGDQVVDEDNNRGIVAIVWNDGDICEHENDAAHPNPKIIRGWKAKAREEHETMPVLR